MLHSSPPLPEHRTLQRSGRGPNCGLRLCCAAHPPRCICRLRGRQAHTCTRFSVCQSHTLQIVVSNQYLVAVDDNGVDLHTFAIASDGAVKEVSTLSVAEVSSWQLCDWVLWIPLTNNITGADVYFVATDCDYNGHLLSFRVEADCRSSNFSEPALRPSRRNDSVHTADVYQQR